MKSSGFFFSDKGLMRNDFHLKQHLMVISRQSADKSASVNDHNKKLTYNAPLCWCVSMC